MPIKINGSTSGSVTLAAPATGSDVTLTLPTLGFGKVLQVVSTTKTDTFASSAGSWVDVTGLSVSITPASTSSQILVIVTMQGSSVNSGSMFARLVRNSTAIAVGDAAGNRTRASFGMDTNATVDYAITGATHFLDSPATTSAVTYKMQVNSGDTGGSARVNYSSSDADSLYNGRYASTITAIEVGP